MYARPRRTWSSRYFAAPCASPTRVVHTAVPAARVSTRVFTRAIADYPEELFPSEKIWLPSVLEPVKKTYLTFPKPLELFLQEDPIPEDAQVGIP